MSQSYLLMVILSRCYATKRLNKCNQYGIQAKVKIAKSLKYQKVHSLARSSVYKSILQNWKRSNIRGHNGSSVLRL